jgi:hypothetical protein
MNLPHDETNFGIGTLDHRFHETAQLLSERFDRKMQLLEGPHMIRTLETPD